MAMDSPCLLLFLLLISAVPEISSETGSFRLSCGSEFTAAGTSFCLGIPIKCAVTLDSRLCIEGEDSFAESDLAVSLNSPDGTVRPLFGLAQERFRLDLLIHHVPAVGLSAITLQVAAQLGHQLQLCCLTHSLVSTSSRECLYPVSIALNRSEPPTPAVVKGGGTHPPHSGTRCSLFHRAEAISRSVRPPSCPLPFEAHLCHCSDTHRRELNIPAAQGRPPLCQLHLRSETFRPTDGQSLLLPASVVPSSNLRRHRVRAGSTLLR